MMFVRKLSSRYLPGLLTLRSTTQASAFSLPIDAVIEEYCRPDLF